MAYEAKLYAACFTPSRQSVINAGVKFRENLHSYQNKSLLKNCGKNGMDGS
jgi:hypothetical protein